MSREYRCVLIEIIKFVIVVRVSSYKVMVRLKQ